MAYILLDTSCQLINHFLYRLDLCDWRNSSTHSDNTTFANTFKHTDTDYTRATPTLAISSRDAPWLSIATNFSANGVGNER